MLSVSKECRSLSTMSRMSHFRIGSVKCLFLFVFTIVMLMLPSCKPEQPEIIGVVKDNDGNVYRVLSVGKQIWMAENMRAISVVGVGDILQDSLSFSYETPMCYYYNNDQEKAEKFGCLYNWQAAKRICPDGWHLPSDAEWTELERYVEHHTDDTYNGDAITIAKALASQNYWCYSPDHGTPGYHSTSNNLSKLDFRPAGVISFDAGNSFSAIGETAVLWSSDDVNSDCALSRALTYSQETFSNAPKDKTAGYSVRCIKDR